MRLVNVVAHVLAETNRHAGHADILREQIDGVTGDADASPPQHDAEWWREYVTTVEAAAKKASSASTAGDAYRAAWSWSPRSWESQDHPQL